MLFSRRGKPKHSVTIRRHVGSAGGQWALVPLHFLGGPEYVRFPPLFNRVVILNYKLMITKWDRSWICAINSPDQLHWVNEPLANHRFDFEQHSGYCFGTCITTATGHWGFSPLDHAVRHTHTEIGPSPPPPPPLCHSDACAARMHSFKLSFTTLIPELLENFVCYEKFH